MESEALQTVSVLWRFNKNARPASPPTRPAVNRRRITGIHSRSDISSLVGNLNPTQPNCTTMLSSNW
jgi:hypothetical protein